MKTAFYTKSKPDKLADRNSATLASAHGRRTDDLRSRTEFPTTEHDITRPKHEHVLHTTPFNLLKSYLNRYHPSSVRKTCAKVRYSAIFFPLLPFSAV
jgi:hypothetical protein